MAKKKQGKKIRIGKTYAYQIRSKNKVKKIRRRIKYEDDLQNIIEKNTKLIFGKKIWWLAEKGKYGDMFGVDGKRLISVEIKAPKSNLTQTGHVIEQIRRRFTPLNKIDNKEDLIEKFKIKNPEESSRRKLDLNFKKLKISAKPDFYIISSQLSEKLIRRIKKTSERRKVRGYDTARIRCILLNVFKIANKKILVMNRYL